MKVSSVNNQNLETVSETQGIQRTNEIKRHDVGEQAGNKKGGEKKELTEKNLKDGVNQLNEAIQAFHEELKFELHEESNRMMTKIVNVDNNEVIKEIPPKETLDMLGKIKKMVGLIIDEKI